MTGKAILLSQSERNMKRRMRWNWKLGLALAALPFIGGPSQESYSQPTDPIAEVESEATASEVAAAEPAPAEEGEVNAPVTPITTVRPLPPGIQPTGPVAEILKLVDSGVDEAVLLAFVTNSPSAFKLDAEQIIFLNDIGIPSTVVTAMIQRDQALKAFATNAVAVAAAPAPAAPPPAPVEAAPTPGEMAPQADYTTGTAVAAADGAYAPFYDSLAPYGTWVNVDGYGACWQPTVVVINSGWRPYCDGGRWIYTDCGWYWLSGYSWGWAPFHYGRWFHHGNRGWCWQPGTTWGPSWVSWRYSGSYCGWAPLPPAAGFSAGFGLTYHGQRVNSTFGFGIGVNSYTFVPVNHFADQHPNRYALSRQHATQIYGQTVQSSSITGTGSRVVNHGIPASRVASASHTQIHRVNVREGTTPAAQGTRAERLESRSGTVSGFRPHFPQSTGTQAPSRGRSQFAPGGTSTVTPSPTRRTSESASHRAEPIILRGSDRSREAENRGSVGGVTQPAPANSLIIIGKKDSTRSQFRGQVPASTAQTVRPAAAVPQQNTLSRLTIPSRPPATVTTAANAQSQQGWLIPRHNESHVRSERPRVTSAPVVSAPAQVPRNVPQTVSAPRETRSLSVPMAAPAPRAAAPESRPSYSAPSRSASSAPASQPSPSQPTRSQSSGPSGRNWR
jgi:hypothetical protein